MTGLELMELNAWLTSQQAEWKAWGADRDAAWLELPTGNERFPTLGAMFRHAFTPLHRYSAQAIAATPPDDAHIGTSDWQALIEWAETGLTSHRGACAVQTADTAEQVHTFQTRSAGPIAIQARLALAHAATHCFWHLGGIAHLLRREGIAPPQRSDLLWFGAESA
jgi:uncharacterized damage-inducible protein DinB